MPRSMSLCLLIAVASIVLTSCAPRAAQFGSDSPLPAVTPIPIEEDGLAIAHASNDFGFRLFHQLRRAADGTNVFISPLSLHLVLAMAYNGASGQTAAEMAQALGVDELPLETVNSGSLSLQKTLLAASGVELLIGNSTWVQEGYRLREEFAATAKQFYDAEAVEADFKNKAQQSVDRINTWASDKTQGQIDQILTVEDMKDIVLILLNAVYFKGHWKVQFDPARTVDEPFYLADGTQQTMPMMYQAERFAYYPNDAYDALALPYVGERVRMVIVLPHEGVALADVLDNFGPEQWQAVSNGLNESSEGTVEVGLPRFTMEYEMRLNDSLKAMGMERAFTEDAELANLVVDSTQEVPLMIAYVQHKAVVQVDEEGTRAAAGSAVGMVPLSAIIPPSFIVNRPFFFAIQDSYSGAVLFMGAAYRPEALTP